MRLFCLAFVAGTLWMQQAQALADWRILGVAVAFFLASRLARGWSATVLLVVAGLLSGYGLADWRAQVRLADELPRTQEGADIEVEGIVSSLPQEGERGTRFLFQPRRIVTTGATVPSVISLTWYAARGEEAGTTVPPPAIRAGERWRFTVRLKRPRGLANPHTFDFEPWALSRGIRATGYVRTAQAPVRVREHEPGWPQSLNRLRGDLREAMHASLGSARYGGVLVALAIGDQDSIRGEDWDVFWRTGVGHLMSISGLHVTMFAGLAFAVVGFLWVRVPVLTLAWPARKAGTVAGVFAAAAYTLLAGYGVPAQRTLVMLATAAASLLADRHSSPSRVLAAAALAVLLVDPWAVLAPGFWLSFGAVGAILYALALRTRQPRWLAGALITQVAVTLVLWPFLATLFNQVSLVSPLANAFAIPLVSLVVVPLTLAGALLPLPALLGVAHDLMQSLMAPLEWLAAQPVSVVESAAAPSAIIACSLAGVMILLAPRGVPMRAAGMTLMMPLAFFQPPVPDRGEAWIDVLDVGHGLAVVVRTAKHALAYDAGPTWSAESDSGSRIVVPFLRGEGVRRLDGLVISHADDDHAGGARSLVLARAPPWLLGALPERDGHQRLVPESAPCIAGTRWDWDGVAFEVLHPPREALHDRRRENDRSCVLRIASGAGVALLTGDIEKRAETEIVSREGARLRADVLLVPHHGSRTSSTPAFVAAVSPAWAVVSSGWRNRFQLPSGVVEARYRAGGAAILRTDLHGALHIQLPARPGEPVAIQTQADRARYWSDRHRRER